MESNRDESLHCCDLAKRKFEQGQYQQALKFAEKSLRLYPTEKAERLAAEIRKIQPTSEVNNGAAQDRQSERADVHDDDDDEDTEDDEGPLYTDQQAAAVRKILNLKDYYDVLGVTKSATGADLKKSYRRLALQFHPDKNKAPGAADAFKAVGNAYYVLSDDDKRRRYDQFGPEESQSGSTPTSKGFGRDFFPGSFEDDIDPDEIFSMFFSQGGFSRQSSGSGRSRAAQFFYVQEEGQSTMSEVVRLAPLAVILILSIFTSLVAKWNESQQLYSFHKSTAYPLERFTTTTHFRIQYYVTPTFEKDLEMFTSLESLELRLENQFVSELKRSCTAQQNKQKRDLASAKFHGDLYYQHEIKMRVLSRCEALKNLALNSELGT